MTPCKILVCHPDSYLPERGYILAVILGEFLGLDYECNVYNGKDLLMSIEGIPQSLIVSDVLFRTPESEWRSPLSLPPRPLKTWMVSSDLPEAKVTCEEIPVIYGDIRDETKVFEMTDEGIRLAVDLFGSAFFMLTRYEEMVCPTRDEHNRFPATASLAYQEGFLERPVIDEYVEILWACMKRLWPRVERRSWEYRLVLSHDVDYVSSSYGRSWPEVIRSSIGDVVKRRNVGLACRRILSRAWTSQIPIKMDPYNTFDFLMSTSEQHGLASTFYFIAAESDCIDTYYPLSFPWIACLLREIHSRGHEVGLHGSYGSYTDGTQIEMEFRRLVDACLRLRIDQTQWGNRQHYLRWDTSITARLLDRAGIHYDTTLAYADGVGFRCGVCRRYSLFDLQKREKLSIKEVPLVAMDVSLARSRSKHLSDRDMLDLLESISERCRTVRGDFTFLCHNSSLPTAMARRWYTEVVDICGS